MNKPNDDAQKLPTWQEFQQGLLVKAQKDEKFRKELLADPKTVLETEMNKIKPGTKLPENLEVKVLEQPANTLYLVLPAPDAGDLSDEDLDMVAGGGAWESRTPQLY